MKILVTGSTGMLGSDVVRELVRSHEVVGLSRHEREDQEIPWYPIDITYAAVVTKRVKSLKPDIVIHTAAYTDVDGCERDPERAISVNTQGTESVAEACAQVGATLVFISTDYVFDGNKKEPYDEEDVPKPINAYGQSKRDAENIILSSNLRAYVIRTSWLFGEHGKNFFRSVIQQIARGEKLQVVDDQEGAPTYTKDLAKALQFVLEQTGPDPHRRSSCVYHLANSGVTSWFHAAQYLVKKIGLDIDIKRLSSEELNRPAARPKNSVLNTSSIRRDFGIQMRSWEEAVDAYWHESLREEWEKLIRSRVS